MHLDVNHYYGKRGKTLSSDWTYYYSGNPSLRSSSFWTLIRNGNMMTICGKRKGVFAMVFSGQLFRDAVTIDYQAKFGGRLSFWFKYGGFLDEDGIAPFPACRESYNAPVTVYYSTDGGRTWVEFENGRIPVAAYRLAPFSLIEFDVPQAGWSETLRFKWEQQDFKEYRDFGPWTM